MRAIVVERPAQTISRLRRARGLSCADACRLADVPATTWRAIESGSTTRPQAGTKVRIARALGVTPSRIWRQRPASLHLEDVDDPRWDEAVRGYAQRLSERGSATERRRFGERLAAVLDCADPGTVADAPEASRFDELWEIAGSLALGAHPVPIAIVDGRLVESERHTLTGAACAPEVHARRTRSSGSRGTRSR